MQIASGFWESEAFWNIVFTFLGTIIGGVVTVYLTWKLNKPKKRTLEYQWRRNYAIPDGAYGLQKPRIVDVSIFNPATQSITADSFHQGQPLEIELDGNIDAIAGLKTEPSTTAMPTVTIIDGRKIQIQPFLLRPRQRVEFSAVIDGNGESGNFKFVAPLTDIDPEAVPDENQLMENFYTQHKKQAALTKNLLFILTFIALTLTVIAAIFANQRSVSMEKYDRIKNCILSNQGNGVTCMQL
ncbi:hypothetical protein ACIQVC_23765 [Streptomyces sp. NPDC101112]|uniref:hypothetical protein n=1 Tax=Streptomyces sp. NPDC101112 TaxID=3366105 RepID=UPI003812A2C7